MKGRRQKTEGFFVELFTRFRLFDRFFCSALSLGLGIWLMGCSAIASVNGDTALIPQKERIKFSNDRELAENLGQMLPISAKATFVSGEVVQLEVTRTPEEQSLGLMYRRSLPDDRGMLFSFSPPQRVSFWMKNTLIPLDMLFLRDGVVRAIAANVPPCKQDPCPSYGPDGTIDQVIELRGGRASEMGIKVGQEVKIQYFSPQPANHTKSLP
ncbi:DUF192 domain-containing protein [Floridanema evergladense]|uniref:DUF192 domain-containing protein n=1 Tax=Floridaenema evergladense BLCC-F167 TaxID=3153639 RepID=A0ABV4WJ88_9CYAN